MNATKRTYEGMFLLDAGQSNFEQACEPIHHVLGRVDGEMIVAKPWDERRLTYEIQGRRRGLYVLTYSKLDPGKVAELERDCQLDERILRVLVLRKDKITEEDMNAETPATGGKSERSSRDRRDRDDSDSRPRSRRRRDDEDDDDQSNASDDESSDDDDSSDEDNDTDDSNDTDDDES